jgi:hypothetical protein
MENFRCGSGFLSAMSIFRMRQWLFGSRRRVAATTTVLLAVVIVVFVRSRSEAPPALVVYPTPFTFSTVAGPVPDRWIPQGQTWGWLWRLRYALLPRSKGILLDTTLWKVPDSFEIRPSGLKPDISQNGLSVWILAEGNFGSVQEWMKSAVGVSIVSRPRIDTSEAVASSIQVGDPSISGGVSVGFLPRVRGETVDLIASALVTSPDGDRPTSTVRTNLVIAFRAQIPPRGGLLVVSDRGGERMAMMLTARIQQPKQAHASSSASLR